MKLVNYLFSDLEEHKFDFQKVMKDVINNFGQNEIVKIPENPGTLMVGTQTYFDTPNYSLLNAGGFLRLTQRKDAISKTAMEESFLEYKANGNSKVENLSLLDEGICSEVEKIGAIWKIKDLKKVLEVKSNNYHFNFQKVDLDYLFTGEANMVDFILQTSTIYPADSNQGKEVIFATLADKTAERIRRKDLQEYQERTDEAFNIFQKTIEGETGFRKISNYRYGELVNLCPESVDMPETDPQMW